MKDFDFDFDFGFSTVDEKELGEIAKQALAEESSEEVEMLRQENEMLKQKIKSERERSVKLVNMFKPLLNNLKRNPEQDYILWKNRKERIEEFEKQIEQMFMVEL